MFIGAHAHFEIKNNVYPKQSTCIREPTMCNSRHSCTTAVRSEQPGCKHTRTSRVHWEPLVTVSDADGKTPNQDNSVHQVGCLV